MERFGAKPTKVKAPKQPDENVMKKLGKMREDLDFLAEHLGVVLPSQVEETPTAETPTA